METVALQFKQNLNEHLAADFSVDVFKTHMKGMTQSILLPANDLDLSSLECLEALFTGTVLYSFASLKYLFTISPIESQIMCSPLCSHPLG